MSTANNSGVSRFFSTAAQSLNVAILAERVTHSPEPAFKRRRTTLRQALGNFISRF